MSVLGRVGSIEGTAQVHVISARTCACKVFLLLEEGSVTMGMPIKVTSHDHDCKKRYDANDIMSLAAR